MQRVNWNFCLCFKSFISMCWELQVYFLRSPRYLSSCLLESLRWHKRSFNLKHYKWTNWRSSLWACWLPVIAAVINSIVPFNIQATGKEAIMSIFFLHSSTKISIKSMYKFPYIKYHILLSRVFVSTLRIMQRKLSFKK